MVSKENPSWYQHFSVRQRNVYTHTVITVLLSEFIRATFTKSLSSSHVENFYAKQTVWNVRISPKWAEMITGQICTQG